MRIFIMMLIQLCSIQLMIAQNVLFLPFNSTRAEVKEFVDSRDYIHEVYHEENTITIRLSSTDQIVYHFEYGSLSKISLDKYYDKRKEGKAAIEGAVRYMGISAEVFMPALASDKEERNYYSISGNKVLELQVKRNGKHTYMQLTASNRYLSQQVEASR